MKILNVGSLNIDHVYQVSHFVQPAETIASLSYQVFSGGKGANQSLAIAKAGGKVMHAGRIGSDGYWLKERLKNSGVNVSLIKVLDEPTGHALIQVNEDGENAIIIHGGANEGFSEADFDEILANVSKGDYLLLQNEINDIGLLLQKAKGKGLKIIYNPAPMKPEIKDLDLSMVDIFIVNESEAQALTGQSQSQAIINSMIEHYPDSAVVLTLGKAGVFYGDSMRLFFMDALDVEVVDTTGAGDTFIGYFVAELSRGSDIYECLKLAVKAAALCVTRQGAGDAIPERKELS